MDDPDHRSYNSDDGRDYEPRPVMASGAEHLFDLFQQTMKLNQEFGALKGTKPPEIEKALDDITSALDLVEHHITDIISDAKETPSAIKAALFVRRAMVEMHKTPPIGAPREDLRTHLDEAAVGHDPDLEDPDLVRGRGAK
jgi:hypothetical protein